MSRDNTNDSAPMTVCGCGHEKDKHYFGDNPGTYCMVVASVYPSHNIPISIPQRCSCTKYKPKLPDASPMVFTEKK